jgi:type IV pilus assembly protein PilC
MPLYRYTALDKSGKKISATLDANSKQHLKDVLKGQGILMASCELAQQRSQGSSLDSLFATSVPEHVTFLFTRQLFVLVRAKLPLLKSIELLSEQFSGRFAKILIDIKDDLKAGSSFAASLEKHADVFPVFYTQLVYAGELSGNLELVLGRLTKYLQRNIESSKKVSDAMIQPLFLLAASVLISVGALVFLVPSLKTMFAQFGGDLPGPTQALIELSDFFTSSWPTILAIFLTLAVSFIAWKRTRSGKFYIDKTLLKLPLISHYTKTKAVVQFSKTLGVLLESNASLPASLEIVSNIINNRVLVEALNTARENIIKEGKIARYLAETKIFPPIAIYMIQTGEESGDLAQMLTIVGSDYEAELDEMVDKGISMINPAMMILIAIILMWLMAAIMLPTLSLSNVNM